MDWYDEMWEEIKRAMYKEHYNAMLDSVNSISDIYQETYNKKYAYPEADGYFNNVAEAYRLITDESKRADKKEKLAIANVGKRPYYWYNKVVSIPYTNGNYYDIDTITVTRIAATEYKFSLDGYGSILKEPTNIIQNDDYVEAYRRESVISEAIMAIENTQLFDELGKTEKPICGWDKMASKKLSCVVKTDSAKIANDICQICGAKDEYANFSQKHNAIVCWSCYGK